MEYKLRISKKARRYHLEMDWDHGLVVVVPERWNQRTVDVMIAQNGSWIERHTRRIGKEKTKDIDEVLAATDKIPETHIRRKFTEEVSYWAERVGVSFNRIAYRNQKSKWGSCSHDGNLNFNLKLAYAPAGVREYVIIHELCHLIHHNHSSRFWAEVAKHCPDFAIPRKWLRQNGRILSNAGLVHR